jgi:hypothetical protein
MTQSNPIPETRSYFWTATFAAALFALAAGCSDDSAGSHTPDAGEQIDGSHHLDGTTSGDGSSGVDSGEPDGGQTTEHDCANPHPDWLLCESFEGGGGDFATWFAQSDFLAAHGEDDRGRIDLSSEHVHTGSWAIHYPAAATSDYRGSGLDWRACDGPQEVGCSQRSFDTLYFRAWIRFAADHQYVHHFLNIGGSQPDDYWYHGTAGCLPSGELSMGTTVDFHEGSHESFFYTYFPEMSCDTSCGNYMDVQAVCDECASKGLPTCTDQPQCCWGNHFAPDPPVALPVGQWFCFEMTMTANTPGQHDGSMAYWVDGVLAHEVTGMMWRTVPELALNRVRLQHYITASDADGHSNQVWFDDVVVSTSRIGCQ